MKKFILILSAIAALVITPIFAASTANAQSRNKNVGANSGYCKSGARVSDMAKCKENGGNE